MLLRVLNADDVRQALPMSAAIEAMKEAYAQLSAGAVDLPLRSRIGVPSVEGVSLFMPALVASSGDFGVKIVSVFPQNPSQGLPTIHAMVIALDSQTGRPLALLEGASLTALRTGAGSGAATDVLARPDARTAAIFGSGVQARTQLEAICAVRPIERVLVFSPHQAHAAHFAEEMAGRNRVPSEVTVADSPKTAVADADIICTATTSTTAVFDGRDLRPGTHINAVGSFTPDMVELDLETLRRSTVVVDSRRAVLEEAGEIVAPIRRGEYHEDDIHAELGEIILGRAAGRQSEDETTLFISVGLAVQDAVAATRALQGARSVGLGHEIEL